MTWTGMFARIQQEMAPWRSFEICWHLDVLIDRPQCRHCRSKCGLLYGHRNTQEFGCVHEMAAKSLAIDSKRNGLRSFCWYQEWPSLSRRASGAPGLFQSVKLCQNKWHHILLPSSFHDELRHEKIFPDMFIKAITQVLAEISGNKWWSKFWISAASKRVRQDSLDLSFLSLFLLFCTWYRRSREVSCVKTDKNFQWKTWSDVPPKLLTCIRFLHRVVQKMAALKVQYPSWELI